MVKRYYVTLSQMEQNYLGKLIQLAKHRAIGLDEIAENKEWSILKMCEADQCGHSSASDIAQDGRIEVTNKNTCHNRFYSSK